MKKKSIIAFIAGKSGGHIIPAITLAKKIYNQDADATILFFSTANALDKAILDNYSFITHIPIYLDNIPRKLWFYPVYILKTIFIIFQCFRLLRKNKPSKIISMGGYISLPVCIAARFLKIPIELFELNAIPGKAIKILSPLARTIWYCFPEAKKYLPQQKSEYCLYPLNFTQTDRNSTLHAINTLNLQKNRKTLFVLGGSQGSIFINDLIKNIVLTNPAILSSIQIIHQIGKDNIDEWSSLYKSLSLPHHVFSFNHNMAPFYNAADCIISRAGAGTIFEILFFAKPAILIPLKTNTTNHQYFNAQAIADKFPQLISVLPQEEIMKDNNLFKKTIKTFL
ncbi:MAG: UDP-N-acetylglucosamine--N-acetylmuramyl-(pentapeptide) pyrophosphoryl-undecaprenol N-acetylglucosamine transferase [Candidatus Babeliales bacterium]